MKRNLPHNLKPIQGLSPQPNFHSSQAKTQASYHHLMLQMMNSLIKQQRQNNHIMGQFVKSFSNNTMNNMNDQHTHSLHSQQKQQTHNIDLNHIKNSNQSSNFKTSRSQSQQKLQNKELHQGIQQSNIQKNKQVYQNISFDLLQRFKQNAQIQRQILNSLQALIKSSQNKDKNQNKNLKPFSNIQDDNQFQSLFLNQQKYYSRISNIQPHTDERQLKVRIQFIKIFYQSIYNNIKLQKKSQQLTNAKQKSFLRIKPKQNQLIGQLSKIKKFQVINISQNQFQKNIIEWLGVVYRATASICWKILQQQNLSFDQVKVLFTENIIFNFIQLMKDLRDIDIVLQQEVTIQKKIKIIQNHKELQIFTTNIINKQSVQILKYLCTQYPQTQSSAPNIALRNSAPALDQKGKNQYQILGKSGVKFTFKPTAEYAPEIMKFINYLIQISEDKFDYFEKQMKNIFQRLFDKRERFPMKQNSNSQQLQQQLKQYREKVKKYTKYAIGRKIGKNTPKYTQQQIQNGVFFLKSTKILRVLVKWVQQLTQYVQNPKKTILNWFYPFKDHNGKQIHADFPVRNGIYQSLINHSFIIKTKLEQIAQSCFNVQCSLTQDIQLSQSNLMHLSQQQANVGMFSSNVRNAMSTYLYMQLNELIHFLLMIPLKVDENKIGIKGRHFQRKARAQLDQINLVTFRIFDLLRCKCVSNEEEIMFILNILKDINNSNQTIKLQNNQQEKFKYFSLVRVKDRLDQGMRDVLINAQFNNGPVCQIQLAVASQLNIKQDLLGQYNHFLYELRRSTMLGPLIQNVSIWTTLQQRTSYFDQINLKKLKKSINIPHKHYCQQFSLKKYSGPVVCISCKVFYHIPRTCLLNWHCKKCHQYICGQCRYQGLSQQQKKRQIFGPTFSKKFLDNVYQVSNHSKPQQLPQLCFITKKKFLRAQLSFIRNHKPTQQFQKRQIAQVVIRGDPFITDKKIKKTNKISTRGFLSQIHIDQKYDFKHFIIFGIDRSLTCLKTIKQLKQMLKQNSQLRIIDLLHQPNYTQHLHAIVDYDKKEVLLNSIQDTLNGKQYDKIIVIQQENKSQSSNNISNQKTIILAQIYISGEPLKRKLIKRANLQVINQYAKKNSSVMSLQHRMLTNELNVQRIDRFIGRNYWQNLCKNVTYLYLNYGAIQNIQSLAQMKNIQILSISDNQIQSLKGVENLLKLKKLKFSNNKISSLVPLKKLINIQSIHGNYNNIKSLEGLQQLVKINELSLYKNQICSLGQYLKNLHNLQNLYLRSNKLQEVKSQEVFKNLLILSLSDNPIKNVQNIKFNICPNIKNLSLSSLFIKKIPSEALSCLKLHDLSLHGNEIQKIQGLENQKQLKSLGLGENKIKKMQNLEHLQNLRQLYLPSNEIKVIQNISSLLDTLEILDLKDNPLESINEYIQKDSKCKILWSVNKVSQQVKEKLLYKLFQPFYGKKYYQ